MLVSSKHMKLVSPVFRAMLQRDGFREGCVRGSEGSVEDPLPDDDPRAMKILLDIVHGRNRRVPRKVSLRILTAIAVLADKYLMVEAQVEAEAANGVYQGARREAHFRWMEISWVVGKAEDFKAMTCLVERGGYSDLDIHGLWVVGTLAVLSIVIDATMKRREEALSEC
ncbi:hypothetical protein DL95DRAFT_74558 [Leptodontidium sp. 2 PMI_412]|nr:hypothetical protein BKA61DRAFT_72067 [Leptodontidium sp. MPI-SDFR-AT-0119]KAH9218739.1 hypothetical protein DL95DRAFT_74558 [Leptodontidium sp. 2 PMI_412]